MRGAMDQAMGSGESSPADEEIAASILRVSRGRHHHGHHHHHRGHQQQHHRGHLHGRNGGFLIGCSHPFEPLMTFVSEDPFEDTVQPNHEHHHQRHNVDHPMGLFRSRHGVRRICKSLRRKNRKLHHGHRSCHVKQGRWNRGRRDVSESPDQPGVGNAHGSAPEESHGFPSHLFEDEQDMEPSEERPRSSEYLAYIARGLFDLTAEEWSPSERVALAVAESLAAMRANDRASPHLFFRCGRKEKKHRCKQHRHHHPHHRRRALRRLGMIVGSPVQQGTQQSVDAAPEAPAAVPLTQVRYEAGPSATYEEKLAEGLIPVLDESSDDSSDS